MVHSSACSGVLQVISGDIDGIIHRHSCCAGFGCCFFSSYVGCGIKCLKFSQRAVYNYYFIHIFTETKKKQPEYAGLPNPSRETRFSGANADREILIFPVQLTTCRIGNLTRLIHTLATCVTIYIHTYIVYSCDTFL